MENTLRSVVRGLLASIGDFSEARLPNQSHVTAIGADERTASAQAACYGAIIAVVARTVARYRRGAPRDLRIRHAAEGTRVPLNVMKGNFAKAADVRPWWNATVRARKAG